MSFKTFGIIPNLLKSGPVVIGLIMGMCFFMLPVVGFDFGFFPGDLGDGRLNLYFLEHAYKWLTFQTPSLWDAPFMYPEPMVLAYSDNLLGSAPIYGLFRLVGFEPYTSYQLWYVGVTTLNYLCAYWFLKYIFKDRYAAVLGAFVFAFSIALQSQMTHAQTFPRFAIPLAFWMAIKFSEQLKPKYFFLTILLVVYQIYCGIYLGFMLAIAIAILLSVIVLRDLLCHRKETTKASWYGKLLLSLAINILLLLPLMLPYMMRKVSPSAGHYEEIVLKTVPTPLSHLFSHGGNWLWSGLDQIATHYPAYHDHQIFAGLIVTLSLVVSIVILCILLFKGKIGEEKRPIALVLLSSLVVFFFYLRFDKHSAYYLIYNLPGFSSMRSIARIINIELIYFAIAVGLVYLSVSNRWQRYKMILFGMVLILLVTDNHVRQESIYRAAVAVAANRELPVDSTFSQIPKGSIVSYEPTSMEAPSIYYNIDAMLLAQKYDLVCVNGYTATCPGDYGPYWESPQKDTRNLWLSDKVVAVDTLYVINGPNEIVKVSKWELDNSEIAIQKRRQRIEGMMNYIRSDKKWLEQIEEKAIEKNISLDSSLYIDAVWMLENQ